MMLARVLAVISSFAFLSSPSANGQRAVDTIFGDVPGGLFGFDVDGVGDVDGDGVEDFIVGMPMLFKSPTPQPGRARVYSGSDRALLYEVVGEQPMDKFGEQVAGVGDLNGDGTPDFAVGAPRDNTAFPSGGMIRSFSGANGAVLWTRYGERSFEMLGASLSSLGDVDGDGFADVLAGAPPAASLGLHGVARVYSGANGSTVYEIWGDNPDDRFGTRVAGLGDCDGDDIPDFAILASYPGQWIHSYIHAYSGATGSRIITILPTTQRVSNVSGVGDVNGDGRNDIAVAETVLSFPFDGGVFVFSGADGASLLLSAFDTKIEHLGSALEGVGDINADGVPDLLVGAYSNDAAFEGAGSVKVLSGADGEVLFQVFGDYESDQIGLALASIDAGQASVVVPSPTGNRVRIHMSSTPVGSSYCASTVNSTDRPSALSLTGINSISANTLTLRANYVPPSQAGLFIYSLDQVQVPFGDGTLCLGSTTQGFINRLPGEQSDAQGVMEHALDVTSAPAPRSLITAGSTWHFQAFFRDLLAGGAGFNFSDAVTIAFVP